MYPVYVPRPVPPEPLYYTEGRIQHEHSHVDISPVFMPGYYMINITFCIHSYVCVIPITPFLQMIQNLSIYSDAEVEKTSKFLHRNAN